MAAPSCLGNHLVHHIIAKDTLAFPSAAITPDAVPDGDAAHLDDLCLYPLGVQRLCHFR